MRTSSCPKNPITAGHSDTGTQTSSSQRKMMAIDGTEATKVYAAAIASNLLKLNLQIGLLRKECKKAQQLLP